MGGSSYSHDAYTARVSTRTAAGIPTFKHTADISAGKVRAGVHADLNPRGVAMRESRDSDDHPITVPIAVIFDTTGSMGEVPVTLEKRLPALMGAFLDDKASGKQYLGDGYPAILIGAVDDYNAQVRSAGLDPNASGTLQVGQFESGIEIDQDLEKVWLTGRGGGTYEESYELALYFMARHTAHDHWDRRGRKGYVFVIGDEHAYGEVDPKQVSDVIGDTLQAAIPLEAIIEEVKERYHVFFIIPNMTSHYHDGALFEYWMRLLGQQNVLKLEDPEKVCELIASTVALCEEFIGLDDLAADDLDAGGVRDALVPLARLTALAGGGAGALEKVSGEGLPEISGSDPGEVERL